MMTIFPDVCRRTASRSSLHLDLPTNQVARSVRLGHGILLDRVVGATQFLTL
jgi:hypothetical protein